MSLFNHQRKPKKIVLQQLKMKRWKISTQKANRKCERKKKTLHVHIVVISNAFRLFSRFVSFHQCHHWRRCRCLRKLKCNGHSDKGINHFASFFWFICFSLSNCHSLCAEFGWRKCNFKFFRVFSLGCFFFFLFLSFSFHFIRFVYRMPFLDVFICRTIELNSLHFRPFSLAFNWTSKSFFFFVVFFLSLVRLLLLSRNHLTITFIWFVKCIRRQLKLNNGPKKQRKSCQRREKWPADCSDALTIFRYGNQVDKWLNKERCTDEDFVW